MPGHDPPDIGQPYLRTLEVRLAIADGGDAVRDITAVFGRQLGLPVEAVPEETFGPCSIRQVY